MDCRNHADESSNDFVTLYWLCRFFKKSDRWFKTQAQQTHHLHHGCAIPSQASKMMNIQHKLTIPSREVRMSKRELITWSSTSVHLQHQRLITQGKTQRQLAAALKKPTNQRWEQQVEIIQESHYSSTKVPIPLTATLQMPLKMIQMPQRTEEIHLRRFPKPERLLTRSLGTFHTFAYSSPKVVMTISMEYWTSSLCLSSLRTQTSL